MILTVFLSAFLSVFLYIDPGTGSIVVQAIIAAVIGLTMAIRFYWHRLLLFFGIRKREDYIDAEDKENTEDN